MTARELRQVWESAAARLAAAGIDEAGLDAELLLADLLGCSTTLLRVGEFTVDEALLTTYHERIARRAARVPLPHILGWQEFCGLRLAVDQRVLIPRWDSEPLCEALAAELGHEKVRIADLGTGSGALAAALAQLCPAAEVWAVDDAPEALALATQNFAELGLGSRIHPVLGDLAAPLLAQHLAGAFDGVISNPPYIPSAVIASLEPEVRGHEPRHALDGGPDGLQVIARVAPACAALLRLGGVAVIECGSDQAAEVVDVVEAQPALAVLRVVCDLTDRERGVLLRRVR